MGLYLSSKGKSRFFIYDFETLKNGSWVARKPDFIGLSAGYIFFVPSCWQGQKGSNPRPTVLETAALPIELYPYIYQKAKAELVVGLQGFEPGTIRL